MLDRWRIIGTWLFRSLIGLPKWWRYDFRDFRIIIEQDDQLRYFRTPASLQRIVVRSILTLLSLALFVILGLLATNLILHMAKARLERSHHAIYATLLADSDIDPATGVSFDMLNLAQDIKDRQQAIQQYIGYSAIALKEENHGLLNELRATDLSEKAIRAIEMASVGGGAQSFAENQPLPQNLLPDTLVNDILKNRELQDVLRALPKQMPLKHFEVTSDFGIRKHPLTGIVHFHNGVDLVANGNEGSIFPAKAGKVIFAAMQPQLGNTVVIQHSHGIRTLYAHLNKINIRVGETVHLDTILGTIGNTGASSTGTHLHFEVLVGGFATNPIKAIRAAKNVQQIQ
ncbi:MAG: M23 family metallopeptidase [Holophagaceae bacterium]|nr:M23 family metallopeptidase [Holophagaceae bacterium]